MKKFKVDKREFVKAWYLLTQIGLTMVVTIGMMLFLGRFLDKWLNTSPWLLLICTLLGVLAAIRNLFVLTQNYWKDK